MRTIPTHKIQLLLSIIQLCVNKIISQFSTLNLFLTQFLTQLQKILSDSIQAISADWIDQSATVLHCD